MLECRIILKEIQVNGNRLEYVFSVSDAIEKYFQMGERYYIQYGFPLEDIPTSILVIPFLCNVLPIAWITDAEIVCDEIDKDFYECIEEFKQGYISQYPDIEFAGRIIPNRLINNKYKNRSDHDSLVFFTGGVDATLTLLKHLEEKPLLFTLWGADLMPEDTDGWKLVEEGVKKTATDFSLSNSSALTSFRKIINEGELHALVMSYNRLYGWYHDFQHGIGIISHAAPLSFYNGIKTVYIAASFTEKEKGVFCASMPCIDNHVRWADTHVIHDGFSLNRQDKIDYITQYSKRNNKKITLRVCWEVRDGKNCCHCEKCFRTLTALLLADADPREYGFDFSPERWNEIIDFINNTKKVDGIWLYTIWKAIQDTARKRLNSDFAKAIAKVSLDDWRN